MSTTQHGPSTTETTPEAPTVPPATPPGDHFPVAAVVADEQVPAVHIWRDFAADPAQVVRAHTDPAFFARWIGPHDLETHIDAWECRTLGSYRYVQRRDGEEYAFRGTFPEVGERRLVQTFCFEEWPEAIALETLTFTDLGAGRTRLHSFSLCGSFEARDSMLASGMEAGVREGYEKLDHLLAEGDTR
ncbi:SRPBCC domain-containing protein [Nocardioides sp. Y6]|uniref:SRPBCC domain-containing protein n=1 Tax=Nocardioides malaquae TaxID=2773426 RepID=A0ABR9RTN3_9ACTN|nr:SRPBCC domain-containing protein [Nocardioides malaquae]MBE7324949.1 SRPBCC domain-containing protein [Nocardioides malaquae]